jgi:hypothetical protein
VYNIEQRILSCDILAKYSLRKLVIVVNSNRTTPVLQFRVNQYKKQQDFILDKKKKRGRYIHMLRETSLDLILISIVGGGVQLGPLSTAATNRPTVPAPGDYDGEIGGMMIGMGKQKYSEKPCPRAALSTKTPTCLPGPPKWEASD